MVYTVNIISDVSGNINKYYGNSVIINSNTYIPEILNRSSYLDMSANTIKQKLIVIYTNNIWRILTKIEMFS
jgi:hypothetical protein